MNDYTKISLNENMLLRHHEELLQEVIDLYHTHPTNISKQNVSRDEANKASFLESQAKAAIQQLKGERTPLQKAGLREQVRECEKAIQRLEKIASDASRAAHTIRENERYISSPTEREHNRKDSESAARMSTGAAKEAANQAGYMKYLHLVETYGKDYADLQARQGTLGKEAYREAQGIHKGNK